MCEWVTERERVSKRRERETISKKGERVREKIDSERERTVLYTSISMSPSISSIYLYTPLKHGMQRHFPKHKTTHSNAYLEMVFPRCSKHTRIFGITGLYLSLSFDRLNSTVPGDTRYTPDA